MFFFQNDFLFFIISMICSIILTLPATIDLCAFSTSNYIPWEWMGKKIVVPSSETVDEVLSFDLHVKQYLHQFSIQTLRTISSILSIVVSLATFVINIILVAYIVRERNRFDRSENRK